MSVNYFFETFMATKAVLILMKPVLHQHILIKEQMTSIQIRKEANALAYYNLNHFQENEQDEEAYLINKLEETKGDLFQMLGRKRRGLNGTTGIGSKSFITLCVYLILLLFTALILFLREDTNKSYYISRMAYLTFDDEFNAVTNDEQLYSFIRDKIGEELLEQEISGTATLPQLRVLSYMVGPIRVMQMRSNSKKCK